MYDEDRAPPALDLLDDQELELREYDWSARPQAVELSLEELRQALAVLAVLDGDDEGVEPGMSLWVH